jgi:uncharacterized paraquat-inducible protein A
MSRLQFMVLKSADHPCKVMLLSVYVFGDIRATQLMCANVSSLYERITSSTNRRPNSKACYATHCQTSHQSETGNCRGRVDVVLSPL